MLKRLFDLVLFSNFFISFCAAGMVLETYVLVGTPIDWNYAGFVFVSTLALYNFPVLAESNFLPGQSVRHNWIADHKKFLKILCGVAAGASLILAFNFPFRFFLYFIPVALVALAYFIPQTHLRAVAGLKAAVVAFVWTSVCTVFPLLLIEQLNVRSALQGWNNQIILQSFLFIFPLCVIFNVKDIEADRKAGVNTLPNTYGVPATIFVCIVSLVLFSGLVVLMPVFADNRIALLASSAISGILILAASEQRSDYYYTFWIDGMILLQAGLVWLLKP